MCGRNYSHSTATDGPGPKYSLKRDFETGGKGFPIADKGKMYSVDVDNCRGAPNKRNGPFPSSQDYKPEKAYAFWNSSGEKEFKIKRGQGSLKIMMKGTHKPIHQLHNFNHPAPNQYKISPVYDGRKPNLSLGKGSSFSTASRWGGPDRKIQRNQMKQKRLRKSRSMANLRLNRRPQTSLSKTKPRLIPRCRSASRL